jgi:hypothetical protein
MTKREKTTALFIELINEQLKPHGVTYEDVKGSPEWYMKYKTTPEREKEFLEHCISRIKKVLKLNNAMAEKEAQWFILQWGLTIERNESEDLKLNKNQNQQTA